MGYTPSKLPRKPPRKSDQGIKDGTCEHCGRLIPAGVYTCVGCGAPRSRNVVVDVFGVVLDSADRVAFARTLMEEMSVCVITRTGT